MSLDLVFCGTPSFAVPALEKLARAGFRIHLVVTQPDRPKAAVSTSLPHLLNSLLSTWNFGLHSLTASRRMKNSARNCLRSILRRSLSSATAGSFPSGCWISRNTATSISTRPFFPKYRGAAPIQWAIANGETVTGVTTMRIDAGLDTGDILLQRELAIGLEDTAESIAPALAELGADLVVETLHGLRAGTVQPRRQDDSQATLARILKKEDGLVDFNRTAPEIFNRIRGFQPWPGAYSRFRGKTLQILKAMPVAADTNMPSAQVSIRDGRLLVGCGQNTSLELSEVQVEGKKRGPASAFIQGYQPKLGEKLG